MNMWTAVVGYVLESDTMYITHLTEVSESAARGAYCTCSDSRVIHLYGRSQSFLLPLQSKCPYMSLIIGVLALAQDAVSSRTSNLTTKGERTR